VAVGGAGGSGSARRLGVARAIVDGRLVEGDVEVADGRVARVGVDPAGRGLALPGLVDLQVNGYAGVDFGSSDVDAVHYAGRCLAADGVLAYGPTVITSPDEEMLRGVRLLAEARRKVPADAARIVGVHVEGPFLSPARAGVHPPDLLRDPDPALVDRLLAAGPVTMLTLAPERPEALALIARLAGRGVVVALGHSDATAAEARAAIDAGASATTHTWNGMRPLGHRDPGILGVALTDARLRLGLIGDGVHVAPEVLQITWRAAPDRICLVTDAVAAAGAPDGRYAIGRVVIEKRDGRVFDLEGRVGGGTTPLLDGVARAVGLGVAMVDAVAAATVVPSRLMRRDDLGVLTVGGRADLLVVSDDLALERVLLGGREVDRGR
jgi:N-acetylglucosamine-6-phosphate deacetylase